MDVLEINELTTSSYKNMPQVPNDNLTPHHMPATKSLEISKDNISYDNGTCLNTRGDTHKLTFTYGLNENTRPYDSALYNSLSYEDRLKFDQNNIHDAYSLQRPDVSA